jgi:hypothetical protein
MTTRLQTAMPGTLVDCPTTDRGAFEVPPSTTSL